MSYKKTGIIVGILLVSIAIAVFVLSKVKLVPKQDKQQAVESTTPVATEMSAQTTVVEIPTQIVTVLVTEAPTEPPTIPPTEPVTEAPTETTVQETQQVQGITMARITAEDKLDYSGEEQVTSGIVSGKSSYLVGSQVVYMLEVYATVGNMENICHFCTYSVYDTISVGDVLTIKYKQTTPHTYAIISMSKD